MDEKEPGGLIEVAHERMETLCVATECLGQLKTLSDKPP
jgi:hypothetical protein